MPAGVRASCPLAVRHVHASLAGRDAARLRAGDDRGMGLEAAGRRRTAPSAPAHLDNCVDACARTCVQAYGVPHEDDECTLKHTVGRKERERSTASAG